MQDRKFCACAKGCVLIEERAQKMAKRLCADFYCTYCKKLFELEMEEVYSEPFSIPEPDKLVFAGWYESGELFRSGCCYKRGNGNIFYFQPGYETYPTYHNENVQEIITNAVRWTKPVICQEILCPRVEKIVKGQK